jgi:hypothetical protein
MARSTLVSAPLLAALTLTSTAPAQPQRPMVEYAAKFVCGSPPAVAAAPVAPGRYFTAINVHNPGERPIGFRKKFAIALPSERAGPISPFFDAKLGPDQAFEIDCADIVGAFRPSQRQRLMKGFAVIQLFDTTATLDVVVVYTAAGSTGRVETMDVERVTARRGTAGLPPGLPDLVPVGDSCVRDSAGLRVTIRNLGTAPSGPSVTTVTFSGGGTVSLATPPIPAGGSVVVGPFPIPPGCFSPDCDFQITADATGLVVESNEANNVAKGRCLG